MSARRIAVAYGAQDQRTTIRIMVNGRSIEALEGEPIATALLCAGIVALRTSPRVGQPRGAFCFMGACQECAAEVDGKRVQTCMAPARDGIEVRLAGPE
ncbi:MAG: (2Fe-2S)-binding protein [Pseudomonadota bacterium]